VEWFDELSQTEWERASVVIDRLAGLGSQARMPFSRSLGDGLFEIRFTLGSTVRRITYRFTGDGRIILLTTFREQRNNERAEVVRARNIAEDCAKRNPWKETTMANYSRWEDIKKTKGEPSAEARAGVEQELDLGQLIYDLRTEAGLSQRELAERMGTTQSVISRLEEGGGARNRIDTLARVATALDRHLVLSFPAEVPDKLTDAVQVA
ncbi:MAG: XRE family transcriptional regulator, partial [Actinomycetia bacterium]|nr:XRE family transcriptional regulator [Actinomycetes bacterium]